jgi:hypothetical protein
MAKEPEAAQEIATFEQMLEGSNLIEREVVVPRWGRVVIRELSAMEQFQTRKDATRKDGTIDTTELIRRQVPLAMVRPQITAQQVDALLARSAKPLDDLYDHMVALNKVGEGAGAEAVAEFQG